MDFLRGAAMCRDGGKPIIALSSCTKNGQSKIVPFIKEGTKSNPNSANPIQPTQVPMVSQVLEQFHSVLQQFQSSFSVLQQFQRFRSSFSVFQSSFRGFGAVSECFRAVSEVSEQFQSSFTVFNSSFRGFGAVSEQFQSNFLGMENANPD